MSRATTRIAARKRRHASIRIEVAGDAVRPRLAVFRSNKHIYVQAIGAALSLDTWTVLRRRDGLSLERAIAVWRLTLTALLSQALGAQKA